MTDDSATDLPDPAAVIRETDWAALEYGFGDPHRVAAGLRDLLHPDPTIRREAQRGLRGAFHAEAGEALPTTMPTAACLAGLLAVPQAAGALGLPDPLAPGRSMRAAVLDLLGHYFLSADDRAHASSGHGPSETALRRLRPAVHRVVAPLLDAEDRAVRHCAVFTAVSLVEHPGWRGTAPNSPAAPGACWRRATVLTIGTSPSTVCARGGTTSAESSPRRTGSGG
ncbi:hypothetical protein [Kitasatospora sp. NPDC054795]